jgi:RNA polymerase sigma-70 factor (ECF subfamily)
MPLPHRHNPPDASREAPVASDREWAEQIRSGDVAAFEWLFRSYFQPLVALALRRAPSEEAASDVVMDVFLNLWRRRSELPESLDTRAKLEAYLASAVLNGTRKLHRRWRSEQAIRGTWAREEASPGAGGPSSPPDEQLLRDEQLEALQRVLAQLPKQMRRVGVLKFIEHKSRGEIARELELSVRTVDAHLQRLVRALMEQLGEGKDR